MIIPSVTATVKESRDIMKINPAAAHGIYRTNLAGYKSALSAQDPQTSAGKLSGNTDHISISQSGARQLEAEKVSRSILDDINTPASPERLAQLRERVQTGTYYIPTDRLTGVLMQRWFGL